VVITGAPARFEGDTALPIRTVFLDRRVPGQASVTTDNQMGGRLAMEHLVGLGHRRIGIVAGDEHVANIQERLAGATGVLAEHGLTTPPELFISGPQAIETGRLADRYWRMNEPPTAVLTTNDVIALGVWQSCLANNVRIPDDLSLVGYDNIHWSELTVPPLTTVAQDKEGIVERALDRLTASLNRLSRQIADNLPEISDGMVEMAELAASLESQRETMMATLDSLRRLDAVASPYTADIHDDLVRNLRALRTVMGTLADETRNIDRVMEGLVAFATGSDEASPGDFANFDLTFLVDFDALQASEGEAPVVGGLLDLLGGGH
jgi:hypothetical protein